MGSLQAYMWISLLIHGCFSELEFSSMTTLTNLTTATRVFAIQQDPYSPDDFVAAVGCSVMLVSHNGTLTPLVGKMDSCDYFEAVGTNARFMEVRGLAWLNQSGDFIVSDFQNNCLRRVRRSTGQTQIFAGMCGKNNNGSQDGSIWGATFNGPMHLALVLEGQGPILYVVDSMNGKLRIIDISNATVSTVFASKLSSRLFSMVFLPDALLFTAEHGIIRFNHSDGESWIVGNSEPGDEEGSISSSRFSHPRALVTLGSRYLLLADRDNHRLRLIDTLNQRVSSVCRGYGGFQDGPVNRCKLASPESLIHSGSTIFIGEKSFYGGGIRKIPFGIVCKADNTPWDVIKPQQQSYQHGLMMAVECAPGLYASSGDAVMTCHDGRWLGTMPTCSSKAARTWMIAALVLGGIVAVLAIVLCYLCSLSRSNTYNVSQAATPSG